MKKQQKLCKICQKVKNLKDFHPSSKQGYQHRCKSCQSVRDKERWINGLKFLRIKRVYGLTEEGYKQLLEKQQGKCWICNKEETAHRKGIIRSLAVDHNHITGEVRGLLCSVCNKGLGCFHADTGVEFLERAIQYINGKR